MFRDAEREVLGVEISVSGGNMDLLRFALGERLDGVSVSAGGRRGGEWRPERRVAFVFSACVCAGAAAGLFGSWPTALSAGAPLAAGALLWMHNELEAARQSKKTLMRFLESSGLDAPGLLDAERRLSEALRHEVRFTLAEGLGSAVTNAFLPAAAGGMARIVLLSVRHFL